MLNIQVINDKMNNLTVIKEKVVINQPHDIVFNYTTVADNWPTWQTFIVQAAQTSEGQVQGGSTFSGVTRLLGLNMKWSAEVNEYAPNIRWGKHITSGDITLQENLLLEALEEKTRLTLTYDMSIGGFFKIVSPMIVWAMQNETKKSLNKLKDIIES